MLDFEYGIRMMKRFIAIVALCLAINPAIKPDQHTKESKAASDKEREPPVVVFDDSKTTAETNSEPQERPKWYRTVNWSNWALVLVAAITGFAVGWQARETAKSAEATQRSVELQEVLNQQWLEFENWKIMDGGTEAEIGTVILISFDIVNPTKMPLTISGYSVSVKGQDTSVQFARTIAPAKSYSVKLDRLLEGKESEDYNAGKLILPLTCSVPYIDAFTKPQQAESDFCFLCGPHGFQAYNRYRG